jgi:GNAT superfamily N-acetyltransferase
MANNPVQMREEVLPADIEAVRRIVESTGFFSKAEADVAAELVEERLNKGIQSGYYFLFAEQDGRVVGYSCFGPIACTLFSYDLYWIAVEDAFRGQGLGRQLLEASEKAIAKLGGRRIYVETSSREQYHPTRAFYLRCDYLEASVLEDFYAPGDSKVTYLKVL